jgi:hypothetical protein
MDVDNDSHVSWTIDFVDEGRSGTITFRDAGGSQSFYWEFGGGDVVAIITAYKDASSSEARRNAILQRVANEAIHRKAPGAVAEIDYAAGRIVLRSRPGSTTRKPAAPRTDAFDPYKFKLMMAILALVIGAIALTIGLVSKAVSTSPTKGIPISESLRAADSIVTLIRTQDSYVPTLHRDPERDRFSLALSIIPADGSSEGRLIPMGGGYRVNQLQLVHILGFDGRTVWCAADGIQGVDLRANRLVTAKMLKQANPSIAETWDDPRRASVDTRLRIDSPDRQRGYEIDPDTLKATPGQSNRQARRFPLGAKRDDFLSAGVRPTPDTWLGLHTQTEAERQFKPRSWLGPVNRAADLKEDRRLYRARLGPELARGNREILSIEPIDSAPYLNAAFLLTAPEADPIRLSNPDSFLMIHTVKTGIYGTVVVSRIDTTGKVIWKTDTGLDRFKLQQILPDNRHLAFIGPKPPIPDKVSQLLLAIISTESGKLSAIPLQR